MANGRDKNGRFTTGWAGGPGRPKKDREQRFLEITQSVCTFDDWRKIIKKAVGQAKAGNPQARKFLADYLLGPPPQKHEFGGAPIVLRVVYDNANSPPAQTAR